MGNISTVEETLKKKDSNKPVNPTMFGTLQGLREKAKQMNQNKGAVERNEYYMNSPIEENKSKASGASPSIYTLF
jgi:2',3'-cyclic-nucleotide 2'-phosphodiesterase (5'-nucleotidase family)